jgi:hypothetical protein
MLACHAIILGIMGNLDKRAILAEDFYPWTPCFRGGKGSAYAQVP